MNQIRSLALAGLVMSGVTFPAHSTAAQDRDWLELDHRLIFQYIGEESQDLGTSNEEYEHSLSEQYQLLALAEFTPDLKGFFHGRAMNIDGETGFDNDTGEAIPIDDAFLELRELYLRYDDLFGYEPAYIQVGRQRLREPRAIWWNSDQDLIKLGMQSTLLNGFIAVGEQLASYRTTDTDFNGDDEGRFYMLGEASWQYKYDHFIEARAAYEDDHSGLESPGTVVTQFERDDVDQEVVWAGIRAAGKIHNVGGMAAVKYRADLMGVTGEEDDLTTAAGPVADTRLVTGSNRRDVRGWAFDGDVIVDPSENEGPVVSVGYAFGSGEDNPNGTDTDNAFRQTDMQGNSSRIGLERNQQRHYGEVLRPDLSNIHVIRAGVAYPVTKDTDVTATYFHYRLDEEGGELRGEGISAPLNGNDSELGQAVDVGFYTDIDNEFDVKMPYTEDIRFRLVVGSFFPGDAYEPDGTNEAFRVFTELKFRF